MVSVTASPAPHAADALETERARAGVPGIVAVTMVCLLTAAGVSEIALMVSRWPGLMGGWIIYAWPLGAVVLVALICEPLARWKHARRLADCLLAFRCCAACGYDLRSTPVAQDGCTVCPECGAAWRLPTASQGSL